MAEAIRMIAGEPRCADSAMRRRHGLRCWPAPWLPTRTQLAESRAHPRGRSSGLAAGGSLAPRSVAGRAGAAVWMKHHKSDATHIRDGLRLQAVRWRACAASSCKGSAFSGRAQMGQRQQRPPSGPRPCASPPRPQPGKKSKAVQPVRRTHDPPPASLPLRARIASVASILPSRTDGMHA